MMRLTIVGYGNQAKAWAKNLHDSAFPVAVGLRVGSHSIALAKNDQIETTLIGSREFYSQDAFALLTPDTTHTEFLNEHAQHLRPGAIILYAHGYSLVKNEFHKKYPLLKHVLFAPKSIGSELRNQYLLKGKLGAVYSLEHLGQENDGVKNWIFSLAQSLGINMGPYPTTFLRETQADLYSEQGLLCSLIPYVARMMFNHLRNEGVEKELAYFECWHELKLIVAAMIDKGPEGFFDLISPNALVGAEKGYSKLITTELESNLLELLREIQDGTFDKELDEIDVEALRVRIKKRWHHDPLSQTFKEINEKT